MAGESSAKIKKIIYGIIGLVVIIQLIPVDRSNPAVVSEPQWDSPKTREFAKRTCFDCHSNETKWPWYSYVAPVSWVVANHVEDGRKDFNMSEYKPGDGAKAARLFSRGVMPVSGYLMMHPEAQLTDQEKQEFIAGLQATFKKAEKEEGNKESEEKDDDDH